VASDEPEEPSEPEPSSGDPAEKIPELAVPKSGAGRAWKSLVPALVFAAVMVIFVVQNLEKAKISFLTFSGRFPLALALLVAAALGALVVFCLGSVRIAQFRKAFRRHQAISAKTQHRSR
jgi:uncharacterized integral membrane protein